MAVEPTPERLRLATEGQTLNPKESRAARRTQLQRRLREILDDLQGLIDQIDAGFPEPPHER